MRSEPALQLVASAIAAVDPAGAAGTAEAAGSAGAAGASSLPIIAAVAIAAMIAVVLIASRVRVAHLVVGFGTTVAMWALGYVAMTAPGLPAGEVLFCLMLLCVGAGGYMAAQRGGTPASGLAVGIVSAAVNLLVVGSLFGGRPSVAIEVERGAQTLRLPLFLPAGDASDPAELLGLRLEFDSDARTLPRVIEVSPRGSAHDAGVLPGDRVRRLDGREIPDAVAFGSVTNEGRAERARSRSEWLAWIGGLFVVSGGLGWFGGFMGRRRNGEPLREPAMLFAIVTSAAVMLLLTTGGLVTGLEAGLAVPDWPNTFGHNMLLYPMSEMKGGIYYEHAHRLFGMLVGLTVLVLVTVVFRCDRRPSVRALACLLLVAVIVQGLLGAMRVTGDISMSQHRADHAPSIALAVVHGVVGQAIFATALLLAGMLSASWKQLAPPRAMPGGGTMRIFSGALLLLLVVQHAIGACYRHLTIPPHGEFPGSSPTWALHLHITLAAVIMVVALLAGFRAKALGRDERVPIVPALGRALHIAVGIQILLGIAAFVAVSIRRGPEIPAWEVVVTTAHQATGAILLGLATLLMAWTHRLVREVDASPGGSAVTPRPATPA